MLTGVLANDEVMKVKVTIFLKIVDKCHRQCFRLFCSGLYIKLWRQAQWIMDSFLDAPEHFEYHQVLSQYILADNAFLYVLWCVYLPELQCTLLSAVSQSESDSQCSTSATMDALSVDIHLGVWLGKLGSKFKEEENL